MSELPRVVAFEDRQGKFVFVRVPEEHGRYVRTRVSVLLAPCGACGAKISEPCFGDGYGHGKRRTGSCHADRHLAAQRALRELCAREEDVIRNDVLHESDEEKGRDDDGVARSSVDLREILR